MVGGSYANPQLLDGQNYGLVSNYTWNIKITQIDCNSNHPLEAPSGCLQYFHEPSATIESFNYNMNDSPYPANMDYAICIKKHPGFCGINLIRATPQDGGRFSKTLTWDFWFRFFCFSFSNEYERK